MSGVLLRTALLGFLCWAVTALLVQTQFYATALVVLGAAALVAVGLVQRLASLAKKPAAEAGQVSGSANAALARELDHAQALLDTVPAALLVLEDSHVVYLNQIGRASCRERV